MLDVVIVGAGGAGIAAARACARRGLSYRVLEAKAHPGGRAVTVRSTSGAQVDLGAHWLHSPDRNPLRHFADSLDVRYAKMPLPVRYAEAGQLLGPAEEAGCAAAIDDGFAAIVQVGRSGRDMPASSALARSGRWRPAIEAALAIKQGVSPTAASCEDFAAYVWEGADLPVTDGLCTLLHRLADGLVISCGMPVSSVDLRDAVALTVAGPWGALRARHVVLTVSTGVLASGAICFMPDLPSDMSEAIASLPMGHCNKMALSFNRPVFGDLTPCILTSVMSADEPVELVLGEGGHDLAAGLFHGSFARDLAAAGPSAMQAYLLDRLVETFGTGLRHHVRREVIVANWDSGPLDPRLRLGSPFRRCRSDVGPANNRPGPPDLRRRGHLHLLHGRPSRRMAGRRGGDSAGHRLIRTSVSRASCPRPTGSQSDMACTGEALSITMNARREAARSAAVRGPTRRGEASWIWA